MRHLAVLLLAFPILAAPHELAPAVPLPSAYNNFDVQVASNGDGFLAVWAYSAFITTRLFAARLDGDGKQLGGAFPLLPPPLAGSFDLFAVGADYAVLNDKRLTIVSPAGEIRRSFDVPTYGLAAANGSRILIIGASSPGSGPYNDGTLLDLEGHVLREHIRFPGATATDVDAYAGGFVVTLMTGTRIEQQRLTADGATAGPAIEVGAAGTRRALTAVRGAESLVVWATNQQLEATLVRADGTAQPLGTLLPGVSAYSRFDVAPAERGYGLAFTSPLRSDGTVDEHFYALATDANGNALGHPQPLTGENDLTFSSFPSCASNGRVVYGVADTRRPTDSNTQTAGAAFRVGDGVEDVRPDILSKVPTRQTSPAIATNGYDFFTAWMDNSTYAHVLDAQLLTRDGDRTGDTLGGGSAGPSGTAAAAYGGGVYLVVWPLADPPLLMARRFSTTGAPLDPQPIVLRNAEAVDPSVIWNGHQFYAVWSERERIYGAIIHPDGSMEPARQIGPESLPADPPSSQSAPDVAWDGEGYVVVWQVLTQPFCNDHCPKILEIRGARVSPRNLPLETSDFLIAHGALRPHIASGGRELFVTYDTDDGVFGKFLSGDSFPIFHWSADAYSNVTWDGRSYVAAWRYSILAPDFSSHAIAALGATRIDETGFVEPFRYAPTGSSESGEGAPDLVSNAVGDTMIVGAWFPNPKAQRAFAYRLDELTAPPAPPPAPSGVFAAADGKSGAAIAWTDSSDAEVLFLVEDSFDGVTFMPAVRLLANTTWAALPYRSSFLRVRAVNSGGIATSEKVALRMPVRRRS